MRVETKEKLVSVFVVGEKEFLTKEDADSYIKSVATELKWSYFDVTYSPDLTEGRGYYKKITIATSGYCGWQIVEDYCFKYFGKAVAWVQNAQAMPNWIIRECKKITTIEDLEKFKSEKISCGVGDYVNHEVRKIVYVGANYKDGVYEID